MLVLAYLLSLCACNNQSNEEEKEESKYVTVYLPVEKVYEDGSSSTYTYNEKGYRTEFVQYEDGEEFRRYTHAYDKKGNRTEETIYNKGKEPQRITYTYDEENNRTTQFIYDKYGTEYILEFITVSTYDDQGRLLRRASYSAEDENHLDEAEPYEESTYVYEGDKQVEYARYSEGELELHVSFSYNKQGDIISQTSIYYDSGYEYDRYEPTNEYTYDEQGNITEYNSYVDGELQKRYSYTCTYVKYKMTRKQAEKLGYTDYIRE